MTNEFICSLNELNDVTTHYNKNLDHRAYIASANSLFTIKGCAMPKKILKIEEECLTFSNVTFLRAKHVKSLPYNQGDIRLSFNHY